MLIPQSGHSELCAIHHLFILNLPRQNFLMLLITDQTYESYSRKTRLNVDKFNVTIFIVCKYLKIKEFYQCKRDRNCQEKK